MLLAFVTTISSKRIREELFEIQQERSPRKSDDDDAEEYESYTFTTCSEKRQDAYEDCRGVQYGEELQEKHTSERRGE